MRGQNRRFTTLYAQQDVCPPSNKLPIKASLPSYLGHYNVFTIKALSEDSSFVCKKRSFARYKANKIRASLLPAKKVFILTPIHRRQKGIFI